MSDYQTMCCQKAPVRKGRAHYICPECGYDVTFELVMYYKSLDLDSAQDFNLTNKEDNGEEDNNRGN